MKVLLCIVSQAYCFFVMAQNVGIGTTSSNKAKLTVVGTGGVNSSTVAYFGDNAGISIQENWPTIGFNQYRDASTGFGKAISTGYGMHLTFNYNNGDFGLYHNGYASEGTGYNQQREVFAFNNSGYKFRLNTFLPGGELEVPNKVYSAQTGNLNLVPLGIINVNMSYFPADGFVGDATNTVGTLLASYAAQRNNTTCYLTLTLNNSAYSGHNKIIVVPGLNFTQANSGTVFSLDTSVLEESPRKIRITTSMTNASTSQIIISGTLLVYGVK